MHNSDSDTGIMLHLGMMCIQETGMPQQVRERMSPCCATVSATTTVIAAATAAPAIIAAAAIAAMAVQDAAAEGDKLLQATSSRSNEHAVADSEAGTRQHTDDSGQGYDSSS